jgi:hypothetical protein
MTGTEAAIDGCCKKGYNPLHLTEVSFMRNLLRASRVAAAIVLCVGWATFAVVRHAAASPAMDQITILPQCSDTSGNTASWSVINNDKDPATVTWTTDKAGDTGTWSIPAGTSSQNTDFGTTDTAVKFVQNGVSQVISNIVPCQPNFQDTECIDASVPDVGLTETWTDRNTVQIVTSDNVPICPGTLTLTSYTLPTNYDGNFFPGNATSVPQTVFDSQVVTLTNTLVPDGEYQTFDGVTLTVKLPTDPCVNYRVSLDYGNVSGNVTTAEYGNNYLGGGLYQAASKCSVPQVLGASTTAPTLTNTGMNVRLTSVIAALFIATALFVFRSQPRTAEK